MRRLLHIFIVPLLMTWSHQYSVEVDENQNGLIYHTFREIYLKNDTLPLIYFINTSVLHEMTSNTVFTRICNLTKHIEHNLKSGQLSSLQFNNTNSIELKLDFIDQLKSFYNETISKNSTNRCKDIDNIFFNFNMTMQKIKNSNTSSILNMLSIKKIIKK